MAAPTDAHEHDERKAPLWVDDEVLIAAIDQWLLRQWRLDHHVGSAELWEHFARDFAFLLDDLPRRAHDAHSLFATLKRLLGDKTGGARQRRIQVLEQRITAVYERLHREHAHSPSASSDMLFEWIRRRGDNYTIVSKTKLTRLENDKATLRQQLDNMQNVPPVIAKPTTSPYDLRLRQELNELKKKHQHAFVLEHDADNKTKVRALSVDHNVSAERIPKVVALVVSMFADEQQLEESIKSIPSATTVRNWDKELALTEEENLRHELETIPVFHVSASTPNKGHNPACPVAVTFFDQGPQRRLLTTASTAGPATLCDRVCDILEKSGVDLINLASMTLDDIDFNSGRYGGLHNLMGTPAQHPVLFVPCTMHVLSVTIVNGCNEAFGEYDNHDNAHPINVIWRICSDLHTHPQRSHQLLHDAIAALDPDVQRLFVGIDDSLPPELVTKRWWTLTEAASWLRDRQLLVVRALERISTETALLEGMTARTVNEARSALDHLRRVEVQAAILVLSEFGDEFLNAEMLFAQGDQDERPGFHAHLQPRRVLAMRNWLTNAIQRLERQQLSPLPRITAAGHMDKAYLFLGGALDALTKHMDCWLHVPLLLDALAGPEAASLAQALLGPAAERRTSHELLCLFTDDDEKSLRKHPLFEHLRSIAAERPSPEATLYFEQHTMARCVCSPSTEELRGHKLDFQLRPRSSTRAADIVEQVDNMESPTMDGRTGKTWLGVASEADLAAAQEQQRRQRKATRERQAADPLKLARDPKIRETSRQR